MVVCSGGSEKQATAPDFIRIDPGFMASFLPLGFQWLAPYVPFIAPIQLDLNAFCALEPPELPTIDASDVWSLMSKDVVGIGLSGGYKFAQLMHYLAWYRFCKCTTGSTPALPSAPSAPTGLPAVNPPSYVSPPSSAPCIKVDDTPVDYSPNNGLNSRGIAVWGQRNATAIKWTFDVTVITPPGPNITVTVKQWDANNGQIQTYARGFVLNHFTGFSYTASKVGTSTFSDVTVQADGTAGLTRVGTHTEVYCDGNVPGGTLSPCCPPDNIAQGQLAAILDTVTLLQRQMAPFATVDGGVHSGLTGTGELTVQGLVGARVDLSTPPPGVGLVYGTPDALFEAGFIAWGNADGWSRAEPITAIHYKSTPYAASLSTKIGYTLPPGVTASITELRREP